MNRDQFIRTFERDGAALVPDVLSQSEIAKLKADLSDALKKEEAYHGTTNHKDFGMVLACPLYARSFIDLAGNPAAMQGFNEILGDGCIVYAYTSSSMPPSQGNYSTRIHVDCPRFIPNYITNMGGIFLLDDFTEENGATYYLKGSHLSPEEPSPQDFYRNASRLIAPAGSAFYFHGRLWHSGGENKTSSWRHAVTMNMCRPFMKQRLDLPRLLSDVDMSGVNERALQKLGYYSQVPASYDEYFQPPEKRKFRQKAE